MVVRPEAILERQKHTKTNEYIFEVKWHQKPMECNTWVKCETLLSMGYTGLNMGVEAAGAFLQWPQ